jgi:hypothetical protein
MAAAAIVKKILYKKNSQYLQISGLKDQSVTPATYVNDAVLVATLNDSTGAAVPGMTNIAGQFQSASNGVYRFPVDPVTFDPVVASNYTLVVDGTSGTKHYHDEIPVQVVIRNVGTEV